MSRHDDEPLDELRAKRDKALRVGFFHSANQYNEAIEERTGESESVDENAAAALSADADPRLHRELEDDTEVRSRFEKAKRNGFTELAGVYSDRHEELTGEPLAEAEEEDDEAALSEEEETRAALGMPDDETLETVEAALGASDVVEAAERGQSPPQYVFDAYDIDPREYDSEYKLRAALRDATPKRLKKQDDEVSTARAALSISERAELDHSDQTAEELIRERHGIDPADYEGSPEELRAALVAKSGYESGVTDTSESNYSALSANRKQ